MPDINFSADLTAPAATLGEMVLRRGKVFACGDYPDKDFSLSLAEARAAVEGFVPCPADLEHRSTVLDGKIGGLVSVELGADGVLNGTVAEPKWLSDVLGDAPRKVSLTWDKASKQIKGIAHVLNPRVPDAAVFGAYAAFSGEVLAPATQPIMKNETTESATPKGRIAQFVSWLSGEGDEAESAFAAPVAPAPEVAAVPPVVAAPAALSPEIQTRLAKLAKFEADELGAVGIAVGVKAQASYAALFADDKVLPAEKEAVVAAFTVAGRFDAQKSELAYFAEGDEGTANFSAVAFLKAELDKRPAYNLTQEQVAAVAADKVKGLLAVFDQEKTTFTDPATGTTTTADLIMAEAAKTRAAMEKADAKAAAAK